MAAFAKFGLIVVVSEYFGRSSVTVAPIRLLLPSMAEGFEINEGLFMLDLIDLLLAE